LKSDAEENRINRIRRKFHEGKKTLRPLPMNTGNPWNGTQNSADFIAFGSVFLYKRQNLLQIQWFF